MNPICGLIENIDSINQRSLFILHNGNKIFYSDFYKDIMVLSSYLANIGVKEGDKVAIISENNPDLIAITFSIWKLKAVPVPINIKLLPNEIEEQIVFADCKLGLISSNIKINLNKFDIRIIHFPFEYSVYEHDFRQKI